jgi:hypothetical protein
MTIMSGVNHVMLSATLSGRVRLLIPRPGSFARTVAVAAAAVTVLAGAMGCGSSTPSPMTGVCPTRADGALLPFAAGNTWNYRVNDTGVVTNKTNTVMPQEIIGGTGPHKDEMAFKVVTAKGVMDQTISYQIPDGDKVIRLRELSFSASTGEEELDEHWDPHKLHIDGSAEHTVAGAQWLEDYQETKTPVGGTSTTAEARDLWSVKSECESVTVPAGTFQAVKIQKVGGSGKMYWYAWGVGKLKETGGQLEELTSYSLVP